MVTNKVKFVPKKIAFVLGTIAFFLVLMSTVTVIMDLKTNHTSSALDKLVKLFYVNLENNAPAFFSVFLLILISLILFAIVFLVKNSAESYSRQWTVLTFGFFYMAFDEMAELHEKLIWPIRAMLPKGDPGIFFFAWVIPAVPLVLFLAFYFFKFLMSLPRPTRIYFILAGSIFVGGAVGLEFVEGFQVDNYGNDNFLFIFLTTLEESMEMAAHIIFIWALLKYIQNKYSSVQITF